MTPAVKAAEDAGIDFRTLEYEHEPSNDAYGEEAIRALDLDPARVFKTLVAKLDAKRLVVAIVPVPWSLNLKALAAHCGAKRASMATSAEAQRATGYVIGGISPLGQRSRLTTVVDASALGFDSLYVSGGKRGLELELSPQDLIRLTKAGVASIGRA
ncbi:MAG: Cys-tRNA(Pro) deacylase [Gammaproteobacteria bacterium]|nr:Cys-tRNA(Pro) deacylase [Gammaproteobacteria bacterium]NIR85927.1 Cys-tRNA(Pro) deacylase [Gammaproteobacteria bacterium]NIR91919.1 Cys-tRNA(Pro) deacylase [Gammaproteobacteria bacterium]NIU07176.1 Cys-tRNA(Pro) deacylase [Gammaproteobacteria bacterium]NIV53989.1 Cys-tRNA(Pro) deacylase [Gammaproteobacteria bacterium]